MASEERKVRSEERAKLRGCLFPRIRISRLSGVGYPQNFFCRFNEMV